MDYLMTRLIIRQACFNVSKTKAIHVEIQNTDHIYRMKVTS